MSRLLTPLSLRGVLIAAAVTGVRAAAAETARPASAAAALLEKAGAETRSGRKAEALAALAKAEGLGLDEAELGRVVRLYEELGDNCRAAAAGARIASLFPKSEGAWTMYADASAYCGRRREALAALDEARKFDLGRELLEQVPYLYLYMGEYRKSLEASDRYIREYPGDIWHWFRRTEAAIGAGDRAAADEALKKIAALAGTEKGRDPELDEIEALLDGRDELLRVSWILTACPERIAADSTEDWVRAVRKSERELSLKALARVLRARPQARANVADLYDDIARQEARGGRDGALRPVLARAYEAVKRGERTPGFLAYAQGYSLAQKFGAAPLFAELRDGPEDRANEVLLRFWIAENEKKNAPGEADPARLRAAALLDQDAGDYGRALAVLGRLQAAAPKDAGALLDLGVAQFLSGDADAAARSFSGAIELDPSRLDGYRNLGAAYEKRGEASKALAAYERALELKDLKDDDRAALLKKRAELAPKAN